jgi:hypothetical protein
MLRRRPAGSCLALIRKYDSEWLAPAAGDVGDGPDVRNESRRHLRLQLPGLNEKVVRAGPVILLCSKPSN